MDIYHRRGYTMRDAFSSLIVFIYLMLPITKGLSCSSFNVSEGLQVSPQQSHYEHPDNVTFSCDNASLALIGHPVRRCLHTGSWDTQLPVCHSIRCPLLHVPKNGTLEYEYKNTSVIAQFSCEATHILIGQQMITCLQNGSWSDSAPKCLAECSRPPIVESAYFTYNCSLASCEAEYTCHEGYKMNGSNIIQCSDEGEWNSTDQLCEITMCTWPNLPPPGKFSPSIPPTGKMFAFNTTLRYQCEGDYVLVGDGSLWCGPTGMWQGTPPKCVKAEPPKTNITSSTTTTTTMSTTTLTAKTPRPTTTVLSCQSPPNVNNGAPEKPRPSQLRPGGIIKYHCSPGYVLEGPNEMKCLVNGSWGPEPPKCVAVRAEETGSTPRLFQWTQVFIAHKKWVGEYQFQNRHYYFRFHVQSVDLDSKGSILALFSEDHGSKFDVRGFRREEDIVFEIESMHTANSRIKNTDWYVHGKLHRDMCTWKYEGHISSPTKGFTTLTMESYIEEMLDDPQCNNHHHMTMIVVSISVAILMVAAVAIVAYYCSRRKGSFRSSGHRSLTSFENPVYEYEHSLK